MQAKIKKADSESWKLAKKLARRKGCYWKPIELLPDNTIRVYSIRNEWIIDLKTLKLLDNGNGKVIK